MKRILLALALWCAGSVALAQSPGPFASGRIYGNSGASTALPSQTTVTAILDRALGSTRGALIERGASAWGLIPPGTAGLPFVSGGAGADPAYAILGLSAGGCNAALTASNGGILYSTAAACAILSGTATARQMLQSGAGGAPAWSTTTWPATSTINRILYSSAANVIGEIATANSSVFVTDSGGIPSWATLLPAANLPAGVNANVLNTITTGYTVQTSDCGKTIQAGTGTTGLFTVTLPSVSGFPATCSFVLKNGDTTRGKGLSGFPSDLYTILWPLQSTRIAIVNGAWAALDKPGMWKLAASVTFNVNHASGSNAATNDCLGTGSGACATIQFAVDLIKTQVLNNKNIVASISNVAETFTECVSMLGATGLGGNNPGIPIIGDPTTPSNVVWQCGTNSTAALNVRDHGVITVTGFKFVGTGTGNYALNSSQYAVLDFANVEFGAMPSGQHMSASNQGKINWSGGSYTVSGSAAYHINASAGGIVNTVGATVSVPSALTFTYWAWLREMAFGQFDSMTFTGSGAGSGSTGQKYLIQSNSAATLSGTVLPGATAGATLSQGYVDAAAPVATTFCTSPSIPANNGSYAFTINVGTSCGTSTGTVTLPSATTGWVCDFHNVTAPATNVVEMTGGTATTVTLTNYVRTTGVAGNWTDSNVIRAKCSAY